MLIPPQPPPAEVMRLWDTLFSSRDRLTYLLYLCCAMLEAVQQVLLDGDFATSVKTLQRFPEDIDVASILQGADKMADMVEHAKRHEAYMRSRSKKRSG